MSIDSTPLIQQEGENKQIKDENYRLGGMSPLKTLFALIAGPLLSQLCNAIYGIVNSFWVSTGNGTTGLEVLSSLYLFDMCVFAFGNLACISASSHISYLFGQKRESEANQLIADLMRGCVLLGMIYPAFAIPITKPVVKWLSESQEIADLAFQYMCVSSGCSFIMFTFQLLSGICQGEGRTWLFGSMQITALVTDMIFFLPLFLVKLKLGVWSAAMSQVISQLIPTTILLVLLLMGKLSIQLKPRMFISKPSPETWKAVKVGFASFILNLSMAVPQFVTQKYIMIVASNCGVLDAVLSLFNIFCRLYNLSGCVLVAFDSSYIPSASYAFGKKLYHRVKMLSIHTLWITFVWGVIVVVIVLSFPTQLVSIFTKDEEVLHQAKELLPFGFMSLPLYSIHSLVISFLQAAKRPIRATFVSFLTTIVPMPIISTAIFFATNQSNLKWMFGTYIVDDISTSILSIVCSIYPFYMLSKVKDGDDFPEEGKKKDKKDKNKHHGGQVTDIQSDATSAFGTSANPLL